MKGAGAPCSTDKPWIFGLVMVVLAGVVVIGGIRRIAATAEKIVPLMCVIYVVAALYILFDNYDHDPARLRVDPRTSLHALRPHTAVFWA